MPVIETENRKDLVEIENVTIRFAGDSGDGMQLTGTQFTNTSAILGNDISTLPDFPAEIRAPAGSLPGVSGFQINFSSRDIRTPGDEPNVLVAMNPAALKVNLHDLEKGGILIINSDAFAELNLKKAGYEKNPLEDGSLSAYRVISIPLTELNLNALKELSLGKKEADRCKNFFALGMMYWLYDRPLDPTLKWMQSKFQKNPVVLEANVRALRAGFNYADTTELFTTHYRVRKASLAPGKYRNITGNEATALGFIAAAQVAKRPLFYASYPITPASDILHELSRHKNFGIKTFQAEDEIAAMTAAIGASFAGHLGLDGYQWTWRRTEIRGYRSGRDDRIAGGDREHPAWRAQHRLANQDGASRPCCRRCSDATESARCPSWPQRLLPIALRWLLRPSELRRCS